MADADSLSDRINEAIKNLTKLKITTSVEGDEKRQMETVIDLVAADIMNTIHEDFVTGDLQTLRAFHESQVNKGQEIIHNNITALKEIVESFSGTEFMDRGD